MHHEEFRLRRKLSELRDRTDFPAYEEVNDLLNALMATVIVPTGERYRHEKRGTTYDVFGVGHANSANTVLISEPARDSAAEPDHHYSREVIFDREEVVIYRDVQSGHIGVRPLPEFMDGRFTLLPHRAGRMPVDPKQMLATAVGQPPAPTTATAPQLASDEPPQDTHARVMFKQHGHIMHGKPGMIKEWKGDGMVRVLFDGDDHTRLINNMNLSYIHNE